MFHKEFYPTPNHVLDMMQIDCFDKVVYEPHGGKADIIKYCLNNGASEVLASEINEDLRAICSKYATIIGTDFLTIKSEQISHVDIIVMNPPFSSAVSHILHAWEIAPEGCEIIALCNWETIGNSYTRHRCELQKVITDYGDAMNIGTVFSNAERTTGVEIGLVRLFKPKVNNDELDDFCYDIDETQYGSGLIRYNEIKVVVNTYVDAVKCFDEVERVADKLYKCTHVELFDNKGEKHSLNFGSRISFSAGHNDNITTKQQFARAFQMRCWQYIFDRVNINKYVTKGVMEDINKFINSRKNYPFTMKNISKMLDIIAGTRGNIMQKAIEEAVDNFTRYTHENRYSLPGWKTNSGYMLNKKFIVDYVVEKHYSSELLKFRTTSRSSERIQDLMKAVCYLIGQNYDEVESIYRMEKLHSNTWYEWGQFEFKVFKKGTAHFKFKNNSDWEILNKTYAKIKGQNLPEKL